MASQPLKTKKIIKKRTKKFVRVQGEEYKKVPTNWRRPRGIDSPCRRRFRGAKKCAKIGYGSDKKTRFVLPNGFKKFLIIK